MLRFDAHKQSRLLVTGSQGEPTSILGRLATIPTANFNQEGDTVVLLPPIPGNEEGIYRAINR